MAENPILRDSITDAGPDDAGHVVISGSHGGLYPAALASALGLRAVLFNDAGVGLERAGISGVMALAGVGMAAAAVDCGSARIGDAADALARGRISHANAVADRLGVAPGMKVAQAAGLLARAALPAGQLPPYEEGRALRRLANGLVVHLLDSASMVGPEHAGEVVITGSHGGLIGGDPARALKAPARIAVFNDAGLGPDEVGAARLPALERRGLAAVTVAATSARIGDAASALDSGVISRVNRPAAGIGARPGLALARWLGGLQAAPSRSMV
ncbi:MAG TPA: hypothetical protein ENJ52_05815 [Aliiroseovarius sp.]|nr:hypothetical protein [Aliiroseovarius sp.]